MSTTYLIGIPMGLGTALFVTLAYFASRRYTVAGHGSPVHLLVRGHLLIALLFLPILFWLWPRGIGSPVPWAVYVVPTVVTFIGAQVLLNVLLRRADASAVAPMMGIKIVPAALASLLFLGEQIGPWQWVGVGLAFASAFLLQQAGGRRLAPVELMLVAAMMLCYVACDTFIKMGIDALVALGEPTVRASFFYAAVTYVSLGLVSLALLPKFGSTHPKDWLRPMPYAVFWALCALTLFAAFGLLGIVLGAMLQSTRGLMAIVLGWLIARMGHEHLETPTDASTLWRRLGAAAAMTAAVGLYVAG